MKPVPLEWFEFRAPPQRVAGRWYGPAMRDGELLTYSVVLDGREVPFKFLRAEDIGMEAGRDATRAGGRNGGERPVLVLLHGLGITVASFWPIAPWLLPTHDLLLVDYNSFSAAETWPHGGVSFRLLAAGVLKIIESLSLSKVRLAGSSLGGGLALLLALLAPGRVEKLLLFNPAVYPQDLPRLYRLARVPVLGEILMALTPGERLIEGVAGLGYSAPEKMPEALRASYTRNLARRRNRWQLMDMMRQLPGHPRERVGHIGALGRLRQPVLVLWGAQERLLPTDTPQRLARDLPHARIVEFADLAHLPHDEAPERLGPIAAEWLAESPSPAARTVPSAEVHPA